MKTEVPKTYKHGFTLSELELRRLAQTCQEHMLKQCTAENIHATITATLLDGSIIEAPVVDDILTLENAGSRQVKKLLLQYNDGKEPADYQIVLTFQNADKEPDSWTSIKLKVVGQTRDWAFLAAADIDERLKKIKQMSSSFIINSRWFQIVPMVISVIVIILILPTMSRTSSVADALEKAYQSGAIKDPIEAIIFTERERSKSSGTVFMVPMIVALIVPWLASWILGKILNVIAPSYNFYWGDYVGYYNKRRSAQNIFWTVIVLGIVVSIISTYIIRFLP